jgi:hypothetical protein
MAGPNDIFFGEPGLTSSEANHVCNVIIEIRNNAERQLSLFTTVTKNVFISQDCKTLIESTANFDADKFKEEADKAPRLFPLSAWLREGIKEKEKRLEAARQIACPPGLQEVFDKPQPPRPFMEQEVTEEWGREQLNFTARASYLALEAEAAAVGKLIHNDGVLQRLRNERTVQGVQWKAGPDGKSYPVEAAVATDQQDDVDALFFELQQRHRDVSKRLNAIKSHVHQIVTDENVRRQRNNTDAQRQWERDLLQWQSERDAVAAKNQKICQEWREEQVRKRQEAAALKITIPEKMEPILAEVRSYGRMEDES